MPTYYSIITNDGLIKHSQAGVLGQSLDLTHLAIGDSNGVYYDPDGTEVALQNELHRASITQISIDSNNANQIIIGALIDETVGPFIIREVGIFDSNGDLFAIGKFPETFKPNLPLGSGKTLHITMLLGFANTPNVNLVFTPNVDPIFANYVDAELNDRLKISENLADLANIELARENLGITDAEEGIEGLIAIATQAEADDDTNDVAALTPLKASFMKRPTFRVSKTSGQSVGANIETKIAYNIVEYDNKSWYDAVNNRFTPQKAGFYLFSATVAFRDISDAARVEARMRFNGNTIAFQTVSGRANVAQTLIANVSTILFLNGTTDYVDIAGYPTNSGNIEAASSIFNNFSGCYLGG